jgi:hypothetical protein
VLEEEETLKYLLLKGIVQEVRIYIYRKCGAGQIDHYENESVLYNTVEKYNMTDKDLNFMLA